MANDPFLGSIFLFAGNFAPRGYALCNGALLPISQNTALFSILGTTFGGNGQTTFALPDLRGRAPIGSGQGPGLPNVVLGESSGAQTVTILAGNMPSHTHAATVTIHASADGRPSQDSPANAFIDSISGTSAFAGQSDGTVMNPGMATAQVAPAGGNQPIGVQNPYLGINYIIALQGIFPSRN